MINKYNPFIPSYYFFSIFCFKLRTSFCIVKGLLFCHLGPNPTAAESPPGSCSSKRSFTLWATVFENQTLFLLRHSACIFGAQNVDLVTLCFFFTFLCRWLLGEKNNTNINTLKTHGTWGCVENLWKCFFLLFLMGWALVCMMSRWLWRILNDYVIHLYS